MKKILMLAAIMVAFACLLVIGVSAEETAVAECTTHAFESAVVTTAPTCTEAGVLTYTCSVCKATEEKEIPATHKLHSEFEANADGSAVQCGYAGTLVYTCTEEGCDYVERVENVVRKHRFYSETVIIKPTCTTAGLVEKTCDHCHAVVEEEIPAEHTRRTNLIMLYAPSCFFEGAVMFDCAACGAEDVEKSIAKTHTNKTEILVEPTCTTQGELKHTCIYCETAHKDVIVAKHNYNVTSGIPTRIAYTDYTQTGVKYFKCTRCDAGEEGVIANPIFIFLGYSATAYNAETAPLVEITCGYTVDVDALELLKRVYKNNNQTFEYGIVGAVESHVGEGNAPLDSATAEPVIVATEEGDFIVKKVKLNTNEYAQLNGKLINIDYDNHTTYFYLALYIYDGEKTLYISDDSCRTVPLPISYSMLADGVEDENGGNHDDVTMNNVSFGDITYSTVEGTQPDAERIDLITNSGAAYKSKEATADSASDENTIASIGGLGSWVGTVPTANALLEYYLELGGDATHYHKLNIETLINESSAAKSSWQQSINNILRAAELMAIEGERVNIDQTAETAVSLPSSNSLWSNNRDWYLTFIDGEYHTDTDLDDLSFEYVAQRNGNYDLVDGKYVRVENGKGSYVKKFTATIKYVVIDYYSFYEYRDSKSTSSFLLWGPTKKELAQLHLDGNALDFLIESSITYSVTWTEGQRAANDGTLNTYGDLIKVNETASSSILTKVETSY